MPQLSGANFEQLDRRLRRYLRSRINDPELINDVSQQAYTNVIAAIRKGENIPNLAAYICRTAHNAHIDLLRQRNAMERVFDTDSGALDEEEYAPNLSWDDPEEIVAIIQELEGYLRELPEREQRILFLTCWVENSVQKTAEEFRLTEGTARKYRDRAAAKFRAIINGK